MSSSDHNQILDEAMRLHQQGKLDDARGHYQKLLAADPDNDRVIFLLANLDASAGKFEQASQAFEKAARLNPSVVDYQLRLGEVYGRLGRLDDASKVLSKALELAPDNSDVHNNLGIALAGMQQFEEAAGHFAKVIEMRPDVIMAHHHYAACLNESGRSAEAMMALERLLEQKPDDAQALSNLGSSYLNQGAYSKAVDYLDKAIQISPDYTPARNKLALALHGLGRLDEALDHAQHTVQLAPDKAEAMTSLGSIQIALGEHDVALGSYQRAWSLDSQFPGAISGLAECYRLRGDYSKAGELLLPHIGAENPLTEIAMAWAKLMRAQRRPHDGMPVVERALASPQLSHAGRVQLGFVLGQLLDQRGDFDRAWHELDMANQQKGTDFDRSKHSSAVDALINSFSTEAMQSMPRSTCASELPVFIVGMPQVGKTIIEQIIASHPDVYGAGELPVIGALSASIMRLTGSDQPYPLNVESLDSGILDEFANTYVARLSQHSGDATRISDTMPMNFFHIGLIELIYPNARIIHCTRDISDTFLACFSKNFQDPLINFSCSLDDFFSFYADYTRLTEHFRRVSSLEWLDVNYEQLVADTPGQCRALIEFLGLEWHPDCDRYFEPDVATMSSPDRIRSLLNSEEIGRAKNYPQITSVADQKPTDVRMLMTDSNPGTENLAKLARLRQAADAGQAEAIFQLAKEELNAGRYEEGTRRWQQLAKVQPDNAAPLIGLGVALHMQGRLDEARQCYERAIRLSPNSDVAYSNLGSVFQGLGQLDDALASFNAALKLQPDNLDAIAGVAAVYDWQGKYADAAALIEPKITGNRQHAELVVTYSRVLRRLGRRKEARALLEDVLENYPPPEGFRQRLHFILGDLYDDDADYDRAFSHYKTGNTLKRMQFEPMAHTEAVNDVIRYCSAERLADLASSGSKNEQPLFIVGMPRSGTSLVEQILASHSKVYAAGEMQTIGLMALGLNRYLDVDTPYPQCLENATSGQLQDIVKIYLDQAAPGDMDPDRITDKMPTNFVHLGFIQMLFPHAKIIHCIRNALDTCLSCYVQNFGGVGMRFAYDLEHIGSFYNDYRKLMNHYKAAISLPILDVNYEELVADQESQSRAIIDFAGLEWDDACLEFHKLPRSVVTASHAQVRKPMYQSSVSRYRNYETHLGRLKEVLGDFAQ